MTTFLRRLASSAVLLFVAASTAYAQEPRVGVDTRVELMSIIFRLAGNPEYGQGSLPGYNKAIDAHFGAFKDHPAIRLARQLREASGVSFDAVMSMAIHVEDAYSLKERVPFDRPGIALDARWKGAQARKFLEAARQFVVDAKFREFVQSQQPLYDVANERLRALVTKSVDLAWFNKFFGRPPGASFVLVPGLANGGGSYGPKFRAADGAEEDYAIAGVWNVDGEGKPTFPQGLVGTIVHEFNHSFANPLVEQHAAALEKSGARMFAAVADAMRSQAYGDGETVLKESLVRACAARYALAHEGEQAAANAVQYERRRFFLWTPELVDLLGEYEKDRARYPSLADFMPRIVGFFDGLAPRVEGMAGKFEASRPRVVSMTPLNGSENVDPALGEIVVRFSRPMKPASYSVMQTKGKEAFPQVFGVAFDETGTVFTLRVRLEPGRTYEFSLNSVGGGAFQSAEGTPLAGYPVRFRTAAAKK